MEGVKRDADRKDDREGFWVSLEAQSGEKLSGAFDEKIGVFKKGEDSEGGN